MILRWRKLFHSTSNRLFKTPRNPKFEPFESSHLHLSPKSVDSTVLNCPSDTIALSFFLWCARQPNYFHAPHSFDRMIPIVHRLTDRFKSVAGIVQELESIGCFTKVQTFLILLRIYWRGDMYKLALEVFDEMGNQNFVPNTFARNVILDILFKAGHFDAAIRFLRETQFPNFISFNIVMCNLCKSNDWLGVREVLREMVKKGFCPNIGTFTMALDCFKKAGKTRELFQLLGFMVVLGKRPSVEIWTILIDGLCRAGEVNIACNLMGKMVDSGCSPTVVTYTSLIKGFFEVWMPNKVFGVWDLMLSKGCNPDLVLYNVLIDSLSKAWRYDDAIDVFLGLRRRKIRPDSYTLSSLASILCSSGKFSLLPKLIGGLDVSVDLVACNSLLNVMCKAGFPSQAVEFYSDMVAKGFNPDSYTYVGLLNSLCKLGRIDSAFNFYREIVMNDRNIDAYVHSAVLDGLVKRGRYHGAIMLFREAVYENYCLDVVSYTIAIHALFRGGRFEEACSLFDQMKQFGIVPNTCTYNVMLRGLCSTRDINAVKKLLRNMESDGVEMDCISFNTIIGLLIRLRRVNSAFLVFMKMCDMGMRPNKDTYSLLFNGLAHVCVGEANDLYSQLKLYLEDINFMDSAGSNMPDKLLECSGG